MTKVYFVFNYGHTDEKYKLIRLPVAACSLKTTSNCVCPREFNWARNDILCQHAQNLLYRVQARVQARKKLPLHCEFRHALLQ